MIASGFGIGRIRWNWLAALAVLLAVLPLVNETSTRHCSPSGVVRALPGADVGLCWDHQLRPCRLFGLGAYTYAIASFNIGESTVPFLLALAVPALFAAVVGAMMFYGRISDVYLGVTTLVVTLILNRFMNATAGDAYRIGNARLGGFNGIPAFPTLNVPGDPTTEVYGTAYYYVVIVCLLAAYLICRWILASSFGRALIGIRENELRMELLGYNVPAYKTAIFAVAGAMAGLAGCLFANWAEIVTPSVFSLGQTAEVLIWVIVGGLGTLVGPMIAAVVLGSLKLALGHQTTIDNSLILGAILILVVLLIPRGFAPSSVAWRRRFAQSQVRRRQARGKRRRRVALQESEP